MGINFNKNSFGRLTAQTARTTNANKTNAQNAPAKANNAQASNNANSLNSATLKSNQGTKFDSNNFGYIEDKPEIAQAKKKGDKKTDKADDKPTEQTTSDKIKDSCITEMQNDKTGEWGAGAAVAYLIVSFIDWIRGK